MAEEKKSSNNKTVVIVLIILIVLFLVCIGLYFVINAKNKPAAQLEKDGTIPYAANVGMVKENEDLAEKLKEGVGDRIPLHFSTTAKSEDGENFKCVLGNPQGAQYDMYFDIYADDECTDQIYVSGLVSPGSQLESFKTNRTFPKGTNQDVTLVVTTVEDDHKTLHLQTRVALTIVVQ